MSQSTVWSVLVGGDRCTPYNALWMLHILGYDVDVTVKEKGEKNA